MDEKHYKNLSVYNISYKTLIGAKLLSIRFDKIDGFVRVYDRARCLVSFGPEKYDIIYNRIRYLIGVKSGITYVFSYINKDQSWFIWLFTSGRNVDILKCYNSD